LDGIDLVPMTQEQFEAWLPGTIEGYAKEHVATGRWSKDEAIGKSRDEHEKLLPQGVATPDNHLWFIVRSSDRQKVGLLWVKIETAPTHHAFIYNIEIDEPFRRRGYATLAMTRLEEQARRMGLDSIKLHVFGHNTAARPLYEKLGYVPTNINMSKTLTR
jgi:ribosomal protein S18 acetylase RimI-like enzyme